MVLQNAIRPAPPRKPPLSGGPEEQASVRGTPASLRSYEVSLLNRPEGTVGHTDSGTGFSGHDGNDGTQQE